jgi:hypothetical protein
MHSKDQNKVGIWLASKQWQPWERGKNDCCTLAMEYHDHMFGTDTLSSIYGKYNDLKSAIKFRKKMPKVNEWFPEHGYYQVEKPQTGDIVIVHNNKFFPSAYIICMNKAWGIMDDAKKMTRHNIKIPNVEYSVWRHETWD